MNVMRALALEREQGIVPLPSALAKGAWAREPDRFVRHDCDVDLYQALVACFRSVLETRLTLSVGFYD
jgi:hypothetical protein